jgi:hypothetical protein
MKVGKQWVLDLARAAPVIVLGVFIAHQFHQLPVQAQTPASKLIGAPLQGAGELSGDPAQQPQGSPAIRPAKGNSSSDEVQQYLTSHSAPNASVSRVDCGQTVGRVSEAVPGKTLACQPTCRCVMWS